MSIASEITRLQTSKADSKAQINIDKDIINDGIDFINNEKVDSYDEKIAEMQEAYKQYIPINSTSDAQIEAPKGGAIIGKTLKGNTTQNGTPTPSSPIEVNNVTGKQTITISNGTESKDYEIDLTSRNLLDYTQLATITENGITITNNGDGTFSVNGTATADISLAINNETFVPMSGTWRMVGCPSGGSSSTYMLSAYVGYWGGGSPNIDTGNGTSITYTGNVKVRFYIKSGTTCNNLLFKPMLTYDTQASYNNFSPYYNIELNKIGNYQDFIRKGNGKNLLPISLTSQTINGLTIVVGDDKSISINGSITATATLDLTNEFKLKSGSYILSTNKSGTINNSCYLTAINTSTNAEIFSLNLYNANQKTLTLNEDTNVKFRLYSSTDRTFTNLKIYPQLEEGTTATLYEPYGYKDKWYIEKNISNVILNGTETWTGWTSQDFTNTILVGTIKIDSIEKIANVGLCNRFSINANLWSIDTEGIQIKATDGNQIVIRVSKSVASDYATFKTWLQTNNTKVYYVLATPTYTLINNEELLNQLEIIMQLYEGQNNILVTGDLAATLDLDYIVKAENHL